MSAGGAGASAMRPVPTRFTKCPWAVASDFGGAIGAVECINAAPATAKFSNQFNKIIRAGGDVACPIRLHGDDRTGCLRRDQRAGILAPVQRRHSTWAA